MRSKILCLTLLAVIVLAIAAAADTKYTYTGPTFNSVSWPGALGPNLSGYVLLRSPLPPNSSASLFNCYQSAPDIDPRLAAFSFTDGIHTIDLSSVKCDVSRSWILLSTDGQGNIVWWSIGVTTITKTSSGSLLGFVAFTQREGTLDEFEYFGVGGGATVALSAVTDGRIGAWSSSLPPSLCNPLTVQPALKQFSSPWGPHTYDNAPVWAATGQKTTIARWGCHLTSAVMLINYQASQQINSFRSDPDDLNTWLEAHSHPYKSSGSVWGPDVQSYVKQKTNGSLGLFYQGRIDKQDDSVLDNYLCTNNPVILQVPVAGSTHFVLATGQTIVNGRSTFEINDPNYNATDLSQASYNFQYLGIREYSASPTPPHALLISGHSPIEFIATDPVGNETGFDPTTGTRFSQIPSSSYATDSILDDIDPLSGDTTPIVKNLEVLAPLSGTFNLKVFGTGIGDFTLDFVAHDIDGNESVQSLTGSTIPGAIAKFAIGYSSTVGSTVSVTHIVTFDALTADVEAARAAGLIDNGIVESLLQKLRAANAAAARGEVDTAANVLGAFMNEVSAQAGKHIDATAAALLTSDTAVLVSSLGA